MAASAATTTCSIVDCFEPATPESEAKGMATCRPCEYLMDHPEIDSPDEIARIYRDLA